MLVDRRGCGWRFVLSKAVYDAQEIRTIIASLSSHYALPDVVLGVVIWCCLLYIAKCHSRPSTPQCGSGASKRSRLRDDFATIFDRTRLSPKHKPTTIT
jgi:hypothetical protein